MEWHAETEAAAAQGGGLDMDWMLLLCSTKGPLAIAPSIIYFQISKLQTPSLQKIAKKMKNKQLSRQGVQLKFLYSILIHCIVFG